MVHRIAWRLSYLKMEGHRAKLVRRWNHQPFAHRNLHRHRRRFDWIDAQPSGAAFRQMMEKITEIVERTREWFTSRGIGSWIPEAETIHARLVNALRERSAELQEIGLHTGKSCLHAVVGIVIGAMLSFHSAAPEGPLAVRCMSAPRAL